MGISRHGPVYLHVVKTMPESPPPVSFFGMMNQKGCLLIISSIMSPVINIPATLAEVSVAKTPENKAETASFETSPARPGEICESTPI